MTQQPLPLTDPPLNTELRKIDAPSEIGPVQIFQLIERSVDSADVQKMDGLYDLFQRVKRDSAEADFNKAFANFQAVCPMLFERDTKVDTVTRSGKNFGFSYTSREAVSKVILPLLKANGLTFSFSSDVVAGTQLMRTDCILSHTAGHSVTRSSLMPISMNDAVEQMKTLTRSERKALFMCLGISSGEAADEDEPDDLITEQQADELDALLAETGSDIPRFFDYASKICNRPVASVSDITVDSYGFLRSTVERKRK